MKRVCSYQFVDFFFFKQKTAYEMRISDWSSDVCSSDLKLLRKIVGPQNITVMAESFLLSAHLAEQSELILTAPSRLTGLLKTEKVRILKPPITLPGFAVKQYWHERFHEDPGNR